MEVKSEQEKLDLINESLKQFLELISSPEENRLKRDLRKYKRFYQQIRDLVQLPLNYSQEDLANRFYKIRGFEILETDVSDYSIRLDIEKLIAKGVKVRYHPDHEYTRSELIRIENEARMIYWNMEDA